MSFAVTVVGGGLSGCEAAWQLAQAGVNITLIESKPQYMSPAHQTPFLCELVCSNSLRSNDPSAPAGLLKQELRQAGSLVIAKADEHNVPAGSALAVDRIGFGRAVTWELARHPRITLHRGVVHDLPRGPTILATGPLTAGPLARAISNVLQSDGLYFYDAIAPIVAADSIDPEFSFRASRWNKHTGKLGSTAESEAAPQEQAVAESGDEAELGDYINCSLDKPTYYALVEAIAQGRKVVPHAFEQARYFESCLPIEVMVDRGVDVLRYGPMRPIGLDDPKTGRWPFAALQLRPENRYGTAYNMVGFQTRLAYPEQDRIFRLIPALRNAEFLRFGSVHRNTFVNSPELLGDELELPGRPEVRFAGLLTGVEGYIESCSMGLLSAKFMLGFLRGEKFLPPPASTAIGALYDHTRRPRTAKERYSPTNINFGLLAPLPESTKKHDRKPKMVARAQSDFSSWLTTTATSA